MDDSTARVTLHLHRSHDAWRDDVIARDGFDVGRARQLHDDIQVIAQIFEHALRTQIPAKRQAVEHGPAAGDDIGPQGDCAEDILTAADAAVEHDGYTSVHRVGNSDRKSVV